MKYIYNIFLLLLVTQYIYAAQNYAVLLAGSNGYSNYRHQADVFHVQQILKSNGVPQDNIITLAYNDIAFNEKNPFPGKVFNHNSGDQEGTDVYNGVTIDYERQDINVDNYLNILKGNKSAVKGGNGKVLESGPDDNVFLFYSGHGIPGLVSMPSEEGLYADQIIDTLKWMFSNNKYNRLVFLFNACYSGSIFSLLPNNINAYAISSASKNTPDYCTFCPPYADKVQGVNLQTCLSSQLSTAFTANVDITNIRKESFAQQFQFLSKLVTLSKASQWGDLEWAKTTPLSEMMGKENQEKKPIQRPSLVFGGQLEDIEEKDQESLDQRLVELKLLEQQYKETKSEEKYLELQTYMEKYQIMKRVVNYFSEKYELSGEVDDSTDYNCYRNMLNDFMEQCLQIKGFTTHIAKYFYHYCNVKQYEPQQYICDIV